MWCEDEWKWLNEYQRQAVEEESQACVVNAMVGSGKTTVLVSKVLYLHECKKVPYGRMAVLTFTNRAAGEIRERLLSSGSGLCEEELACFGTFHGVALNLLKTVLEPEKAGYTGNFTVMEPEEELGLAERLVREHGLKIRYPNRLKKRLEQEKGAWLEGREESRLKDGLFSLFSLMEEEKRRLDQMTFFDLISISTRLLAEKPYAPEWIIVDEAQDCDKGQLDFLEALRGEGTKLFALGDPNQVIYSWRGGGENMFYLLKNRFGAKELSLPVNYRSSGIILEAAGRFRQFGASLDGVREMGEKIRIRNHYDPFQEAEYLAERIGQLHEEGVPYGRIAVFYRLQEQAQLPARALEKAGIPYYIHVSAKSSWEERETEIEKEEDRVNDRVNLMTLHASKGLEFGAVFIIGVNQGLIPLASSGKGDTTGQGEEEERRLFFVGMTRARDLLELSYYTNPGRERTAGGPGRFLLLIPERLTDWEKRPENPRPGKYNNLQQLRRAVQTRRQTEAEKTEEERPAQSGAAAETGTEEKTWPVQAGSVQAGSAQAGSAQAGAAGKKETAGLRTLRRVKHARYGVGEVTAENETTIEVEFPGYGKKQFLRGFGEPEEL